MTLADVSLPVAYEWGRAHALLFLPQLAARLAEIHAAHGSHKCVPMPRVLTDGRRMLSADILTEVMPGGMLNAMWEAADKAILLPAVEVVPIAEAVALLPVEVPFQTAPASAFPGGTTTINGTLGGRTFGL